MRLVSLHPLLTLPLTFQRVPEIHDGFEHTLHICRSSTGQEVLDSVMEELGLTKTLPGGHFEYVLEEVFGEGDSESKPGPHSL